MLPKVVTGWQTEIDDFLLKFGLSRSNTLSIDGDKLSIETLRDWLNFCENLTSADNKYVILLANADSLSPESQNILLKPLEEKKDDVEMYLLVKNEDKILPTILSRCEVLSLKQNSLVSKYWTDLLKVWKGGPVEILNFCESFDFEDLEAFLNEVVSRMKIEIGKGVSIKRIKIINCFLQTCKETSVGNVNRRMALENLLFKTWELTKTI